MVTTCTAASSLAALQAAHPEYFIRRTSTLWIATRRDDHPLYAPTIIEPDLATFARTLASPPADRAARPYGAFGQAVS